MQVRIMTNQALGGKRVLIREDLNVPMESGKIVSEARLVASLPTIRAARGAGAKVILLSHLGRPVEGEFNAAYSLRPVATRLGEMLGCDVPLARDYLEGDALADLKDGAVVLCENVRFNKGEKNNSDALGKKYAALCDIFVMDAFATAHRAEASTHAVARFATVACAGPLLARELDALERSLAKAERPLVAIIGGSKVSTKLAALESLGQKADHLIVGGGIANNVIKAAGYEVGKSLYEPALVDEAARLMQSVRKAGGEIPVPVDVVVGEEFSASSPATVKKVSEVDECDMIFDIGPETSTLYASILQQAKTIVWNGPVGAFEVDQFGRGTEALCRAVAASSAFSIAGGGDTLAAVEKYGVKEKISYLSTGGGAFLEFLEGKSLPAVTALEGRFEE